MEQYDLDTNVLKQLNEVEKLLGKARASKYPLNKLTSAYSYIDNVRACIGNYSEDQKLSVLKDIEKFYKNIRKANTTT